MNVHEVVGRAIRPRALGQPYDVGVHCYFDCRQQGDRVVLRPRKEPIGCLRGHRHHARCNNTQAAGTAGTMLSAPRDEAAGAGLPLREMFASSRPSALQP